MNTKKYIGLLLVLSITACIPFLVSSKREGRATATSPLSPMDDTVIYTPLVMKNPVPSPTQTSVPLPPTPTTIPPSGNEIIADHTTVAEFNSIPASAIAAAAAIDTLFMHQSTGDNINSLGLECLQGTNDDYEHPEMAECPTYPDYYYDRRNWDWPLWDTPMADAIAKTDQWVSVVHARQQNYQVLGMKFCYVDGWNQDFEYYRQKMEELESAYPDKTFIWTTSVLWGKSTMDNNPNPMSYDGIQSFNQQLRAYAIAHNKILFDMADIESHDSSGNPCQSNGYEALCEEWYSGWPGGGGGHPNGYGSIRLAKGFWWLMARIAGWDGAK